MKKKSTARWPPAKPKVCIANTNSAAIPRSPSSPYSLRPIHLHPGFASNLHRTGKQGIKPSRRGQSPCFSAGSPPRGRDAWSHDRSSWGKVVPIGVVMPAMDGPSLVRQIRQRQPGMPVLFMSGYAEEQLRKEIDIEGIEFLPKPFTVQQITDKVGAVLAAGRADPA
ncbi:MAG: response regulator [Novosphingobium sp.]